MTDTEALKIIEKILEEKYSSEVDLLIRAVKEGAKAVDEVSFNIAQYIAKYKDGTMFMKTGNSLTVVAQAATKKKEIDPFDDIWD